MGTRFEYEGKAYVKTGPLLGSGEGGQRLIPKYAVLKVLDGSVPEPKAPTAPLTRETVLASFDQYHAICVTLIPLEHRPALEDARAAFLKSIE